MQHRFLTRSSPSHFDIVWHPVQHVCSSRIFLTPIGFGNINGGIALNAHIPYSWTEPTECKVMVGSVAFRFIASNVLIGECSVVQHQYHVNIRFALQADRNPYGVVGDVKHKMMALKVAYHRIVGIIIQSGFIHQPSYSVLQDAFDDCFTTTFYCV